VATTETTKANKSDVANKPDEANGAISTDKVDGAIKVNKVIEADNISLTKNYLMSDLYCGISTEANKADGAHVANKANVNQCQQGKCQ
jgi:hypothetical protein